MSASGGDRGRLLAAVLPGGCRHRPAATPSRARHAACAGRRPLPADTVVRASARYRAGGLHRLLFGDNYRDLWATPIRVPMLDLHALAGGLTPGKGGRQRPDHQLAPDGARAAPKYVFRPVYKDRLKMPEVFRGTVVEDVVADGLSAQHPGATVLAPTFLEAAGVCHPSPELVLMPDDERPGEVP